jgi:coenzyme F420-reducing hydrogenase beta subunit
MNEGDRLSDFEHCDACGDPTGSLHDTDAGQQVCPDCYTMTLKVERDAARKQFRGAVETLGRIRDHANSAEDPALLAQHELDRIQRKSPA